ncbi:MAG: enoyl-CoA hydratase-related protein [Parachlamydiales bacterium]|jgi:methylglutaconyl-CoA hydratase
MPSHIQVSSPHPLIVKILLTRPDKRNALNVELLEQLLEVLDNLPVHARAILLAGEGAAFCTGMDLNESSDEKLAEKSAFLLAKTFTRLYDSPLITLAAVHGTTYAGGAGLMLSCDVAIGTPELQIAFPETRRGLVAVQVFTLMQRKLPGNTIRKLLLLGETIDASEAHQLDLISSVYPLQDLENQSIRILLHALQGGPEALRKTKQLLNGDSIEEELQKAAKYQLEVRGTSEAHEGAKAFLEKRAPNWIAAEPVE